MAENKECVTIIIAIADDDPDDHLLCSDALKETNFKHCLATVPNGAELLDLLKNKGNYSHFDNFTPDFIILDVNMPIMDGLSALKEIKTDDKLKNIPVY